MKIGFLLPALMLAGAAISSLAQAAPLATEVAIQGTIKPGTICTPTIAQSRIDYGDIATNDLIKDEVSVLDRKPVRLDVACTEYAKLSIQFIDSKQDSATTDADFISAVQQRQPGVTADHAFGLGTFNSAAGPKNIGSLFLGIDPEMGSGDQNSSRPLISSTHRSAWAHSTDHFLKEKRTGLLYSVGSTTTNVRPVEVQKMHMSFYVVPAINSKLLDYQSEVNLDGKLTIEIRQL